VISSEFNIGHGEKLDRDAGTLLTAEGFVEMPAGHPQFAWTGAETIIQIHGPGPFNITYMDPADTPSVTKSAPPQSLPRLCIPSKSLGIKDQKDD
jgi:hypothetical protein